MDRLTGGDLLLAIRAAGSVSRAQLLRLTGYVNIRADGSEQLDSKAFNDALLAAARTEASNEALPGKPVSAPTAAGQAQPSHDLEAINHEITRNMVKTVIALPLLDQLNAENLRRQKGDLVARGCTR